MAHFPFHFLYFPSQLFVIYFLKNLLFYSQRFILGAYKVCLFKDSRKRRIWCIFNWLSYFGEICSRVGSTPKSPEWAASGPTLGWRFLLGCICGMSPLSPMGVCVFSEMKGAREHWQDQKQGPREQGVKGLSQHGPPTMSSEREKGKLSTIVSAPKRFNLWRVPGHGRTPRHQGESVADAMGRSLFPALASQCRTVSKDKEEALVYRDHLILTVL